MTPKPESTEATPLVIAIDGPSASGKSTLARRLAQTLHFAYVDTGAMYRTLAWWCCGHGVDVTIQSRVLAQLRRWKTRLVHVDGQVRLLVHGYHPEKEIRTPKVTDAASKIAVHPAVRRWMVARQRDCLAFGPLVMEGRDIGTKVVPETEFKLFIDATPAARQARRAGQGGDGNLAERDRRDSQRRGDPLIPALGAWRIDNSGETPEATLARILERWGPLLSAAGKAAP